MKKLTAYFLIVHTIMILIVGFGMRFVLTEFFPTVMVDNYFIVPLFFFLLGIISIFQFRHTPISEPKKMINVYMLMRMIKIFVSLVVILIYWFLHKSQIRNFAIIFIIFYIINLIWETYIYTRMELYFKYKDKQKKNSQKDIES